MSSNSVIEVTIPLQYVQPPPSDSDTESVIESDDSPNSHECVICMHPTCFTRECQRTLTHTTCCSQVICCGCFIKLLRRCKCAVGCRAIAGTCPFCRDMMRAETILQVYLATIPPCRRCQTQTRELSTSVNSNESLPL